MEGGRPSERSGTNGRGLSTSPRPRHRADRIASRPPSEQQGEPPVCRRGGLGGAGGADPPVPIPNTVVKRPSADDTRRAAARDNRPVPGPSPLASSSSSANQLACRVPLTTLSRSGYPIKSRRRSGRRSGRRSAGYVDNRRVVRREGEPLSVVSSAAVQTASVGFDGEFDPGSG